MFQRILVPLDGSERSEYAIPVAAQFARASGGTLVFVHVVFPLVEVGASAFGRRTVPQPGTYQTELAKAERYLTHTLATTYAHDLATIPTEMRVEIGEAFPGILSAAQLEHVDLIVLCSHGETGLKRWAFGSVAQQMVRYSPAPVLVLNEHGVTALKPSAGQSFSALVALDGSPLAELALEPAARLVALLATPGTGALHLLRVGDVSSAMKPFTRGSAAIDDLIRQEAQQEAEIYLKGLEDWLRRGIGRELRLTITSSFVLSTDVGRAICDAAEHVSGTGESVPAQFIALATHGRSGSRHLVMGSVAESVIGRTRHPLFIIRPHQRSTQETRTVNGK